MAKTNECCNCHCPVGSGPKVLPVSVDKNDDEDRETWCPTCFVYHRAPLEPGRWPAIAPLQCLACGTTCLTFGPMRCTSCKSVNVLIVAPASAVPMLTGQA